MSKPTHNNLHADSIAIHGGAEVDDPQGALVAPMYQTSTFVFPNAETGGERFAGETSGYVYSRLGNPTVRQLEQRVAALEGMEDAAASATGMGAVAASTMAFLESGDHVVASDCIYGCSFALFSHLFKKFGIEVSFVDMSDAENIESAITEKTKMVFLETPANPHLKVIDLAPVGKVCQKHSLKFVVDNTFMTPLMQSPREFGADLIIHSATKYLNGHGDVVAGIVAGSAEDIELIKLTTLKDMGATMSPHDAWLILRGLKTLPIRMQRHCQSALEVVDYLQTLSQVSHVYFPGLHSEKEGALIGEDKQMKSAGAVIAFDMAGGYQAAVKMLNSLNMIKLAVSLGDAETLIQHPASMTHSPLTPEARAQAGIGDGLVRISIGLEHPQDIIADLEQAFSDLK
ncbi:MULTISPECIES: PLP-dependent aspartate aminotransferase family protein [Gammaproteobacteria]|uniref:trans-sulfuration enzyme family protein n=1 Tax=Gammaproteobacteria TaxID=1236 RepID=UPI000DD03695|nr:MULTISPECIES: aminotransferase class I/II-fold pyridoxal phosphate-dependent enzyme [Gammaproteobacteria]RTE87141.1 aminotransferase class I/II-fold pyridoxal phosphate-dependent enzyme [Aliidiomarina sp. B3213]TCZ93071.1 aminotransferase class I/II-fold pyridoxal phosphate-dependent enzyme [Lysobacter sp. N42]